MSDGYSCDNTFFAAALCYLYGDEALLKIAFFNKQRQFHFDIASLDGEEYSKEFKTGTLAISDLLSYSRSYSYLNRILFSMNRSNTTTWNSESWIAGRGK